MTQRIFNKILILFLVLFFCLRADSEAVSEKIMITMNDGTELAALLYRAYDSASLPVILIRSPYGKEQYGYISEKLAENGYIVIAQDVRGTGESSGEYIPFVNEAEDGTATINWIIAQKWSSGKIGMWGASYAAFCADIAAERSTGTVNSVLSISGGTTLEKSLTPGGAFHLMLNMTWLHFIKSKMDSSLNKLRPLELMNTIPVIEGFRRIDADRDIEYVGRMLAGHNQESGSENTSFLHITGWYDFFNVLTFDQYNRKLPSPGTKNMLIAGPWYHDQIYSQSSKAGDEDFGPESIMGTEKLASLIVQWFDYSLKGYKNDISKQKNVKVFVMGINRWEEYDRFPPSNSTQRAFYLGSGGNANSVYGDGTLLESENSNIASDCFTYDPLNPVPTNGGALFHFYKDLVGVRNQSETEKRSDVLVYTTAPLNEKIRVVGKVTAEFYAGTEGMNTDFTAKLVEIKPDGYSKILCDGIIRMVPQGGTLLEAGRVYSVVIELGYIAAEFLPGSKIGLEISSSNFPKYDRNPNTGMNPLYASVFKTAKQTIYHGGKYPSKLIMDVIY